MASNNYTLNTWYAKRIIGDAGAENDALLQLTNNNTLILTNRSNVYNIKYLYDSTNGNDKIEFYGGQQENNINVPSAWIQLDTGNLYVLGNMGIGHGPDTYKLYVNGTGFFSGFLTVRVNGESGIQICDGKHYNNDTFRAVLDLNPDNGNHGIWSSGYLNGTTFTSDGKWLLVRSSDGSVQMNGNAATATQWAAAQTVYVTLGTASTTTTLQGGSSSAQTIGVNGTLAVGNGGTGATSFTANCAIISGSTTTSALTTRGIRNNTTVGALGWTATTTDITLTTTNTIAYWNGAYSGTSSNLTYCNKGAFGDMATKTASDYATAGHTHTLSLAATGTASINLAANTVYTLTAGGKTYAFKTPADANTNTWRPVGTGASDAAAGNHTHTLSLAATGTASINLAANTVYTLTAGGKTYAFKTPADANTNTWRGYTIKEYSYTYKNNLTNNSVLNIAASSFTYTGSGGGQVSTPNGYTPVAICGFDAPSWCSVSNVLTHMTGSNNIMAVKNLSGSTKTNFTVKIRILYLQTG